MGVQIISCFISNFSIIKIHTKLLFRTVLRLSSLEFFISAHNEAEAAGLGPRSQDAVLRVAKDSETQGSSSFSLLHAYSAPEEFTDYVSCYDLTNFEGTIFSIFLSC